MTPESPPPRTSAATAESAPEIDDAETTGRTPLPSALLVIAVTSLAATVIGLVALLFERFEEIGDAFLAACRGEGTILGGTIEGPWRMILPAVAVTIAMPLIVRLQRRLFPGTEGTGIPQAIAAVRIGDVPERRLMLSFRIAFGKILLLGLALVAGVTVGREGPSVHVGACAMQLSSRFCRVPPWLARRGLVLAGGAAGISAAFNTPLAGAIFCFEEIGRTFDRRSTPAILRTIAIACIIGTIIDGDRIFYGRSNETAELALAWANGDDVGSWLRSMRPWLAIPVVAVAGGLLGGGFARTVVAGSRRLGPSLDRRPLATGLVLGLTLAAIGLVSGGASYGGGHGSAIRMLESAAATGQPIATWSDPLGKAAGSLVALVSGIPGGLFDPSLTVGAGLGQMTHGVISTWIAPGIGLPALMLLFMAAYFAGVVRSPITVAAILFEMTAAPGMLLPLMITSMLATLVAGRVCDPPIYEALADAFLGRLGITPKSTRD